jgi:hypothetical protein
MSCIFDVDNSIENTTLLFFLSYHTMAVSPLKMSPRDGQALGCGSCGNTLRRQRLQWTSEKFLIQPTEGVKQEGITR